LKSGSLKLLDPSGSVQVCNGIAFLIDLRKVPEDDIRKIETCRRFDGFCGEKYIYIYNFNT
jgi:hypothetical protein